MEILNHESSKRINSEKSETAVINLWLSGGLVIAVLGYAVLSGVLILKLGGFEDTKRRAQEAEATLERVRTELPPLQVEVNSLKEQKRVLEPTIADWAKRLTEIAEAKAALAALESKRRQAEADNEQAVKRLEDTNKDLVSAGKQKAELDKEIKNLKAEHLSLTRAITAAKVPLEQAMEAERRLNAAQNELASLNTQRKQLETDTAVAQKRIDQIHREADDARKVREKLDADAAMLRQQGEMLKGEITDLERKVSSLKAIQATVQQEERKLEQIRKEVTEWELRRDTAKADSQKTDSALSAARTLLQEASAKQVELVRESSRLESMIERLKSEGEQLTNRLERIRKEVTEWELRRDTAKADSQKADSDLSTARTLLQEMSAKQDEFVRESSRLQSTIERLNKEKEVLAQEIGRLEGQQPKSPSSGQ